MRPPATALLLCLHTKGTLIALGDGRCTCCARTYQRHSTRSVNDQVGRGLLYIATLMLAESVLGLPWSLHFTFVLEER